jgi:tyrosine decarboxylase/aspartate 1-decarboxylase
MEADGVPRPDVDRELLDAFEADLHLADGNVLYSMCNSPPQLSRDAHMQFIESNLGDPDLYPGTQKLEQSVINMLLHLLHADRGAGGMAVAGGSEANITALWIYRNLTGKTEIVLPRTAHYSFETAADLLRMDLKYVDVDDQYAAVPREVERALSSNTAAVVAIAGTTEHGQLDPIGPIQKVCLESSVPLHVDAAFGGLVFPFLHRAGYDIPGWDFNLEGVTSIAVDPHKMGQATMPCGVLLMRDPALLDRIARDTFYLSTDSLHSLLGTRCSAGVASAYAMMRHLGITGFTTLVQDCMSKTRELTGLLEEFGFCLAIEPIAPVVCIRLETEHVVRQVRADLARKGWRVSISRYPPGIRLVMMPHIPSPAIAAFVADFRGVYQA